MLAGLFRADYWVCVVISCFAGGKDHRTIVVNQSLVALAASTIRVVMAKHWHGQLRSVTSHGGPKRDADTYFTANISRRLDGRQVGDCTLDLSLKVLYLLSAFVRAIEFEGFEPGGELPQGDHSEPPSLP